MAVIIEAWNVVIRNATVDQRYPGGMSAYERRCPNSTFCTDGLLSRVAFMDRSDAFSYIEWLTKFGFLAPSMAGSEEIALIEETDGSHYPCDWISMAMVPVEGAEVAVAWLRGSVEEGDEATLVAPPDWKPQQLIRMHASEIRELEYMEREDRVDVYRDRNTGKELYVGRPKLPTTDHDRLYGAALSLLERDQITIATPPVSLGWFARRRVAKAIKLLKEAVAMHPDNWAALWVMGKAYQAQGRHDLALESFSKARQLNQEDPDVAREAGISAMESGRPRLALDFTHAAVSLSPDDAGLRANLGLAYLLAGQPEKAREALDASLQLNPADPISRRLSVVVDEVIAGQRPCPHHASEIVSTSRHQR